MAQVKTNIEIEKRRLCREALAIARERFPNLCAGGILPKRAIGEPVDLDDIAAALTFLDRCRRTKVPRVHSFDLRRLISNWNHGSNLTVAGVQLGAVIAAAVALGFEVQNWHGVTCYAPHAMIGVSRVDTQRQSIASEYSAHNA